MSIACCDRRVAAERSIGWCCRPEGLDMKHNAMVHAMA